MKINNTLRAVAAASLVAALVAPAAAQSLFTTQQDFAGWSGTGWTATTGSTGDADGSTINGLGNTTAPGGTGTAGALEIAWGSAAGTYGSILSAGEQGNTAFISDFNAAVAAGDQLDVSYSVTGEQASGTYFQLLLLINSAAGYNTANPTSGGTSTAAGISTAVYSLASFPTESAYSYFQLGFVENSNDEASLTIDKIQIVPTPEPASLAPLGIAAVGLLARKRRKA